MPLNINPKVVLTKLQAKEGILDPAFGRPSVNSQMSVRNGIKADKQILFLQRISKATRVDPGCGLGKRDLDLGMSEKVWTPRKMKMWFDICEDELEDTFWVWMTDNGIKRRDISNLTSFYKRWVLEIFQDAAEEDFLRYSWLGDTAADNVSGGGVITNGVAAEDYQQVDGFWKQIFAGVTATTIPRITITENGAATQAAQLTLPATASYDYMKAVYNNADSRLRARKDKVFLVSGWLFRNRIDQKESLSDGLESFAKRQNEEHADDSYRKIPIIDMENIWDRWIETDFSNGTILDFPNRIVLTTKENLAAGFDDMSSHNKFETWFEKQDEAVNFRGIYKADVKLLREFMISVAY